MNCVSFRLCWVACAAFVALQYAQESRLMYQPRYCGAHRISFRRNGLLRRVYFTVSKNVFSSPLPLDAVFQLTVRPCSLSRQLWS